MTSSHVCFSFLAFAQMATEVIKIKGTNAEGQRLWEFSSLEGTRLQRHSQRLLMTKTVRLELENEQFQVLEEASKLVRGKSADL